MHKTPSLIGIAGIIAIACGTVASADTGLTVLLGDTGWETFAAGTPIASLSWAGEDETFAASTHLLGTSRQAVAHDETVVDAELLTGLPAPEPPAIVLAGLAFGGVLCGRSFLTRRRRSESESTDVETQA